MQKPVGVMMILVCYCLLAHVILSTMYNVV